MMRTKKAFTLIELLVVIAIIALLLAVVIPAMGKAKDYVKRVVCGNNARQTVLATIVYSQNHDNKTMPLYTVNGTNPPNLADAATLEPHNSYRAYHPSVPSASGVGMRPFHLAVLYDQGLIDTPEVFYCPAQPRSAAHYAIPYYYDFYVGQGNPADYGNPSFIGNYQWGTVAPNDVRGGTGLVRTSFNYWTYGKKTLQEIGGYKPFIFDNIQDWRVVPHRKGRDTNSSPQGLTVAYADGHVSFCNDPEIWEDNASNQPWNKAGTAGKRANENVGQGPGNNIAWFNEILRRLQAK